MSILQKIKKNIPTPNELYYLKCRKRAVLKQTILLEASHGREVSGHIYALAEQLQISYPEYQIYIAVRENTFVKQSLKSHAVVHMSKDYLKLLATCEILINDTSFWSFFHKRKEQKYYIFWHGTPLKKLGKSTQVQGYGNVQRNLAAADKIFVNNDFTKERLAEDFGVQSIVDNEFVVAPSPRNSALFVNRVKRGRYLYMPTWRGTDLSKVQIQKNFYEFLNELDEGLNESEELFLKLHPYEESLLNFSESEYKHIKLFPKEENVYVFLQTVEQLITDYSSIMFDFYVTKRPILLFTYDKEEYIKDRGLYFDLKETGFPECMTVKEILQELHYPSVSNNHEANPLLNSFIEKDTIEGTKIVLDYLLKQSQTDRIEVTSNWNGKENVLIYAYQLADNGITASLLNLFDQVDRTKRNYIVTWQEGMIPTELEYKVKDLPDDIHTFIQMDKVQSTISETIETLLYMTGLSTATKKTEKMYQRDFDRTYPNVPVTHFIHYPGYDRSYCVWTWALRSLGIETFIFVHTDMQQEFQVNPQLKPKIIQKAYSDSDHVVCVTKSIEQKVKEMVPTANTIVMNVLFYEQKIQKMSTFKHLDKLPETLKNDFASKEICIFTSVGRFSKQKGYDRLITAFERLNHPLTRLVLICSYGPEKQSIDEQVAKSPVKDQIYILEKLHNPYAVVSRSNAFVFSSRYEGLGMVVFESLALGVPVVMTRIPETLEVLGDERLALVTDNSTNGIYQGMTLFLAGKRPVGTFDFDLQKSKSIEIWESFF